MRQWLMTQAHKGFLARVWVLTLIELKVLFEESSHGRNKSLGLGVELKQMRCTHCIQGT